MTEGGAERRKDGREDGRMEDEGKKGKLKVGMRVRKNRIRAQSNQEKSRTSVNRERTKRLFPHFLHTHP